MSDVAWPELPESVTYVRTTADFTEDSVPKGLLRAHQVAAGVWGRLVVTTGSLVFSFENNAGEWSGLSRTVAAGETQAIPPECPHRVTMTGPVEFAVEFHRLD